MARFTLWILAHRRLVALCWLLVAVISLASTATASNALTQNTAFPGQPGYQANLAILRTYGNGGDNAPAAPVITLPAGVTMASPGVRAQRGSTVAIGLLALVVLPVPFLRSVGPAAC